MDERPAWAGELLQELAGLRAEVIGLREQDGDVSDLAQATLKAVAAEARAHFEAVMADIRALVDGAKKALRPGSTGLCSETAGLAARVASLEQRVSGLEDRAGGLAASAAAVQDDITVNFASAQRSMQLARSHRADMNALGDQVDALTKLVHTLTGQVGTLTLRGDA